MNNKLTIKKFILSRHSGYSRKSTSTYSFSAEQLEELANLVRLSEQERMRKLLKEEKVNVFSSNPKESLEPSIRSQLRKEIREGLDRLGVKKL